MAISDRELQLGVRLGCRAAHLGRCGEHDFQVGLEVVERSGLRHQGQTALRCSLRAPASITPSFVELAQYRADDIAIIVGPHPLTWIRRLEHPIPRLDRKSTRLNS